jgi:uracil-DNA glycosylase family 4
MSWSERQRLMLQEMGLRVWAPAPAEAPAAPVPEVVLTAPAAPPTQLTARIPPAPPAPPAAVTVAPDDRTAAIAAMPWPALREAVAECSACSLCQSRRQTVFGVGHAHAHWMIVGEAPGEQEDMKGEPFVGAAGHLLDSMLRALNLTRDEAPPERQVYIANTLKCRPPRNRNPEPEELARCEPFLMRQIELIRPKLILAMGRFAVQALLRSSEPIGKLRGRVHRYQGVPLVVTYHPAYLLRNLADKSRAWEDLCLAAQVADATPSSPF